MRSRYDSCIDWTSACVHPVIWEVMRSYVFASPLCSNGENSIKEFKKYVEAYMRYAPLNEYDLENMGKLFFYFTAVCNFYGQYYETMTENKIMYLEQAELSSKLLRWFDKNIEQLTKAMKELAL